MISGQTMPDSLVTLKQEQDQVPLLIESSAEPESSSPIPDTDHETKPKQKRNRIVRTCYRCRSRKAKCNFEIPCSRCIASGIAHLCSRDESYVVEAEITAAVSNELRLVRENEILKKNIRDLENALLRSNGNEASYKLAEASSKRKHDDSNDEGDDPSDFAAEREHKHRVVNNSSATSPGATNADSAQKFAKNWKDYSMTLGAVNKSLIDGLQAYDGYSFDWDSVEWSRIKHRKLIKGMRMMSKSNNDERSDVWNYQLKVVNKITKSESDIIIRQAIFLPFVSSILDVECFLEEYEKYWSDEENKEKHITAIYSKSSNEYFFLGVYYNLMCIGLYFADDTIQDQLNFTDNEWNFFPRSFFNCGIECIYRAGFMTYPSIRAIQIFLLMKVTARSMGGSHFVSCLLSVMIYQARKLGMDKIVDANGTCDLKTRIKIRCWWSLVNIDWFEDLSRYSLISRDSFTTSYPRMWIIEDRLLDWDNYYQLFSLRLSVIKRTYYYEDSLKSNNVTLQNLIQADVELKLLEVETSRDFKEYMDNERVQMDPEFEKNIAFIKFLVQYITLGERFHVNSKMSSMISRDEWMNQSYHICYSSAKEIIARFTSPETSMKLKNVSFVPEIAVLGAVFLLVDCMLNIEAMSCQTSTIPQMHSVLNTLGSYKQVMRPAERGKYMIQKLITLTRAGRETRTGGHFERLKALTEETENSIRESSKGGYHRRKKLSSSKVKATPSNRENSHPQMVVSGAHLNEDSQKITSALVSGDIHDANKLKPIVGLGGVNGPTQLEVTLSNTVDHTDNLGIANSSENSSKLSTNILDILEDSGWEHFLSTINDFETTLY